jgi:hypothetical protein
MPVHHHVEQPVEEKGNAALGGQGGVGIPPLDEPRGVTRAFPYGDERALGHEGAHLGLAELRGVGGDVDGVHVEEQMARVALELGALVILHRVLDRQGVQVEVARHRLQVGDVGVEQVEPEHRLGVLVEQARRLVGCEAVGDDLAVLVKSGRTLVGGHVPHYARRVTPEKPRPTYDEP